MSDQIPIEEACKKYGLEQKKLAGFAMRNAFDDPLVTEVRNGVYFVADDWRLQRLSELYGKQLNFVHDDQR